MTTPTTRKHDPKDVLNRFYDAERIYMVDPTTPANLTALTDTLSPEIKIIQTPALPYGGTWSGLPGFQAWGSQMAHYFDVVDVQDPVVFANKNSDKLVINATVRLRIRKTQRELGHPICQVVVVDTEAGVVKEIMPFYWDVRGVLEALELE